LGDQSFGYKAWTTYRLTQANDPTQQNTKVNFTLEVTQTYIFYWPIPDKFLLVLDVVRSCRTGVNNAPLPQPEFWVEVHYKFTDNTGKTPLKKARVFLRADFDVDGRAGNVAITVKEPFDNIRNDPQRLPVNVPATLRAALEAVGLKPDVWACPDRAPPVLNFFGESPANIDQAGGIVCKDKEYGKQDYDNYHQGNPSTGLAGPSAPSLWIPFCTPALPWVHTPCVHIHLKKPDPDNEGVHQWIYAVQYHSGEININPENVIGPTGKPDPQKPEQLDDIVFWYVAESSKSEDFFFSEQGAFFQGAPVPFQWAGLTCWTLISNPSIWIASRFQLLEGC